MDNKQKGILYALVTALVIGAGFIPARKAMEMASAVEVNFIWYLSLVSNKNLAKIEKTFKLR